MALKAPRTLYGIESVTMYHRDSGLPYGTVRVLGGSSIAMTGELVQLTGGSNPFPWEAQDGNMAAEMSFKPKEIPDWFFKIFLGKTPTEVLGDPGNVTALTNVLNSSAQDAVTGVASVAVTTGSEADIKFGKYVVKVVTPTTVDVYGLTGVDFHRGTNKVFEDDLLKITATPLTITTLGVATVVSGYGVELIGGSGAIAMTAGDTAEFEANPPSSEQMDVLIGETGACIPEFGAFVTAQKKGDGSMWLFDCYKVKAQGFPLSMEEKAYSEAEVTAVLQYCSAKNAVLRARHLKPTSGCS